MGRGSDGAHGAPHNLDALGAPDTKDVEEAPTKQNEEAEDADAAGARATVSAARSTGSTSVIAHAPLPVAAPATLELPQLGAGVATQAMVTAVGGAVGAEGAVEGAEAVDNLGDFAWKARSGALLDAVSNAQLTPELLRQVYPPSPSLSPPLSMPLRPQAGEAQGECLNPTQPEPYPCLNPTQTLNPIPSAGERQVRSDGGAAPWHVDVAPS